MQTARVFNNGNSQAIRIPKEYRFEQDEVIMNKIGSAIVIFQRADRFNVLMESLKEFTTDLFEDGRPSQTQQQERGTFD